jgi:hypothetical protein
LVSYNLRFPGQYYQAETGIYQNTFRDYDSTTGRYIESDPIGLLGLHAVNKQSAKQGWMLLTGQTSGGPPLAWSPQTNPYDYATNNPLGVIDPRGQFGVVGVVAIIATGVAAGAVIYATYKCVKACDADNVCPCARNTTDPEIDQARNAWVTGCKQKCVASFGELGKLGPW